MRLPPEGVLRPDPPPDDLLLVIRGVVRTLSDAHLANQVADCWERWQFFGVSVFGAPEDDLVAVSAVVRAIRIRPLVRVTRCAVLRAAGFDVLPTSPTPGTSRLSCRMRRRRPSTPSADASAIRCRTPATDPRTDSLVSWVA